MGEAGGSIPPDGTITRGGTAWQGTFVGDRCDRRDMTRTRPTQTRTPTPRGDVLLAAVEPDDCGVCGQAMAFEVLTCEDGHEEHCPDRVCTGCGVVVVVGLAPLEVRASA